MRQMIIDTETTGLNARTGDRIIEVGCVELINRQLSGKTLHFYVNPGRDSAPGALAVHGLTTEFLSDKPKFAQISAELCQFVKGAQIIIHNAPFDLAFLDSEFALLKQPPFLEQCGSDIIDTLALAKTIFPGKRNSLDALCDRFGISTAQRTVHGALLDAELLARMYLAMTCGQESLMIDREAIRSTHVQPDTLRAHSALVTLDSVVLPVLEATPNEICAHTAALDALDQMSSTQCVWRAIQSPKSSAASA